MNRQQLLEALQGMRFLHDIELEYLEMIADVAQLCDFGERQTVFREGEVAAHVYLVVFGNVAMEICAPGVGCRRILTVGPGDVLAWSAVLEQSRLTATARTLVSTRLVRINAAQLLTICEHNPRFGYEIMRRTALALSARLSATRMQLLDIYGTQLPASAISGEESHAG